MAERLYLCRYLGLFILVGYTDGSNWQIKSQFKQRISIGAFTLINIDLFID